MAELADKYVKLPQLGTFKKEADNVYVAQVEGKTLTSNDYDNDSKAKLDGLANIKKVQIGDKEQTVSDDGTLTLDVQAVIDGDGLATDEEVNQKLQEYTKTENLADDPGLTGKFLDKETAQSTYANRNDIPKVQIPTCTQEELEGKKATAVDGDRVVVTDEEYHIYIYIGETGTGEWKDTGTHVNLSDYVQKDGNKVLVDPDTVSQVDTNKQSIESLQTTVSGLDEKYVKTSDMQVATDEDIKGIFATE